MRAGIKALYGTTIGLSTIMLISALLVAFCDKIKCRYLMYISCFILFILGVTGFMLTLVSSVAAPAIFFSCQFLDYSLSSSAHFQSTPTPIQATSPTSSPTPPPAPISPPASPAPVETS